MTLLIVKLFTLTQGPTLTFTSFVFIVIIEYFNGEISSLKNVVIGNIDNSIKDQKQVGVKTENAYPPLSTATDPYFDRDAYAFASS